MFPSLEPHASGILPVGEGQGVYWETSGNPQGKPAVFLHGGPGGGMGVGYRRRFDPERYLIVGFEQRGCGRSLPLATHDLDRLALNTTPRLIADMELLREHLGIERWLLHGVSWGTALALAYAQAHPGRVSELVLMAVTPTDPLYVTWITETVGVLFPQAWDEFARASGARPGQRIVDAYLERLTDPDPAVREAAAEAWCRWEDTHITLDPGFQPGHTLSQESPESRQNFATLVAHYWRHGGFWPDGSALAGMARVAHLPAVLIHGRYDVSGPTRFAWDLHRAWPGSEFVLVAEEGHGGPQMVAAVREATDRFATRNPQP
ncbi:prolyl aminopeptidase [Deinococcus sp. MIMF12]|uniref:Proline iminopeptidase n=1 Tax=Deinococcus rhizophilus TaxID=3049544 RepID=A0ABT7JC72_9DEIO|nr:prolyl aminopeptidase [Deinococcus rhizophilus]MDL2342636.1 prolyl aminopeptidase [Deinococcus rhizophilus]